MLDPYLPEHSTWLKIAIRSIRSGLGERSYSSGSADAILIFKSGMDARWRARVTSLAARRGSLEGHLVGVN